MCPFVDEADARCATQLTLANLLRAFAYCADRYTSCPIYQELIADAVKLDESGANQPALVAC